MKVKKIIKTYSVSLEIAFAFAGALVGIVSLFFALGFLKDFSTTIVAGFVGGSLALGAGFFAIAFRRRHRLKDLARQPDLILQQTFPGVEGAFLSRGAALLEKTLDVIREEKQQVIFVGATLRGYIIPDSPMSTLLLEALQRGVDLTFLLTHPDFLCQRYHQELRSPQTYKEDLLQTVYWLTKLKKDAQPLTGSIKIRLYRGSPTMFMVASSRKMILIPYTHMSSAMNTPCFIISRESPLFDAYLHSHFSLPWESAFALSDNPAKANQEIQQMIEHLS